MNCSLAPKQAIHRSCSIKDKHRALSLARSLAAHLIYIERERERARERERERGRAREREREYIHRDRARARE